MPPAHRQDTTRILQHLGSVNKLQTVGMIQDPMPGRIMLQVLHLKRAEQARERE